MGLKKFSRLILGPIVFFVLIGSTVACNSDEFVLNIFGDQEAVGASVFVDCVYSGTMTQFGDKGSHFAKLFHNGTLTVEVKKDDYVPYREVIEVHPEASEHYVRIRLVLLGNKTLQNK
jgi:hypothetical protein